jgi:hypothetical protein
VIGAIEEGDTQLFGSLWKTEGLYAFLFAGHGLTGSYGTGENNDSVAPNQVRRQYGLGTIWALFCESAPKWQMMVSGIGGFKGYSGLASRDTLAYEYKSPDYIP